MAICDWRLKGCAYLVIISTILVLTSFPTPLLSQCGAEYQIEVDCSECGGTINYETCCVPTGCITVEVRNGNCGQAGLCSFLCGDMLHNTYYYCPGGRYVSKIRSRSGTYVLNGDSGIHFVSASYKPSPSGEYAPPVNVQIDVPSTVPLQLLNVQVTPSPSGMGGMRYTLRSDSEQGLVAVEIKWTISFATGNGIVKVSDVDGWAEASGMLGPGAETTFQSGSLLNKQSNPVISVAGTITYAEFADGTRVGPDANGAVYHRLREDRIALKAAYQQLLSIYRSGGKEALLSAITALARWPKPWHTGRCVWRSGNLCKRRVSMRPCKTFSALPAKVHVW